MGNALVTQDKPGGDVAHLTHIHQALELSSNLAGSASYGAAIAQRLAELAHSQLCKINIDAPMESQEELQAISALIKMSNDAQKIGLAAPPHYPMAENLKVWAK